MLSLCTTTYDINALFLLDVLFWVIYLRVCMFFLSAHYRTLIKWISSSLCNLCVRKDSTFFLCINNLILEHQNAYTILNKTLHSWFQSIRAIEEKKIITHDLSIYFHSYTQIMMMRVKIGCKKNRMYINSWFLRKFNGPGNSCMACIGK
jgi:hypothetical protein